MKILKFDEKKGEMSLQVESLNDLWVLYNVIYPGDKVEARTVRRVVVREGEKGERRPMKLGLTVVDVSFYEFANRLRIKGQIYEGPEDFVSMGKYHTLNLEPGQSLKVIKETWYGHLIQRIRKSIQNRAGIPSACSTHRLGRCYCRVTLQLLPNYHCPCPRELAR